LRVFGQRMDAVGLVRTADPGRGDIGLLLVGLDGVMLPHAALCIGDGLWGIKVEGGAMELTPLKVLAAWAVPQ